MIYLLKLYFASSSTCGFFSLHFRKKFYIGFGKMQRFLRRIKDIRSSRSKLCIFNICHFPGKQLHLVSRSWKMMPVFQAPPPLQLSFTLELPAMLRASQWPEVTCVSRSCPRKLTNNKAKLSNNSKPLMLEERSINYT